MKTPRRSFVVEYKSPRRRSGTQPNAVWGNVDIKALVRDAEADAPHLFPEAVVSKSNAVPGQVAPRILSAIEKVTLKAAETPIPKSISEPSSASRPEPDPVVAISARLNVTANMHARITSPKLRRTPLRSSLAIQKTKVEKQASVALQDELAALEKENRRLKAMFAEFLRKQNTELRRMLMRFAV
jgi:hypothetical protein